MHIQNLELQQFRCFRSLALSFDAPLILIEGKNGTGKTSILEALHYLCFLRSFRTATPAELTHLGEEGFFVKATFTTELPSHDSPETHDLSVGFTPAQRLVKLDGTMVTSYKQVMDAYRIITLTEDDIRLITGEPQYRRSFIDQAILLTDPAYYNLLRRLRSSVIQRIALLRQSWSDEHTYQVWTEQLWEISQQIVAKREEMLVILKKSMDSLIAQFLPDQLSITFSYQEKLALKDSAQQFCSTHKHLYDQERRMGRCLFGPQLDDIVIHFEHKKSRRFASRGQQKLIVTLLKVAQLMHLTQVKGPATILCDDFMTDFDDVRCSTLLQMLKSLESQVFLTFPQAKRADLDVFSGELIQRIRLTD